MPSTQTTDDPPISDMPIYWFARLEKAVEQGDYQTAADAQKQLARLGVRVVYGRPQQVTSSPSREGKPHV
jgi:hypothetical protein